MQLSQKANETEIKDQRGKISNGLGLKPGTSPHTKGILLPDWSRYFHPVPLILILLVDNKKHYNL